MWPGKSEKQFFICSLKISSQIGIKFSVFQISSVYFYFQTKESISNKSNLDLFIFKVKLKKFQSLLLVIIDLT